MDESEVIEFPEFAKLPTVYLAIRNVCVTLWNLNPKVNNKCIGLIKCIHLHPVPKAKFVLGSSITTSRRPFWNDCNPDSRETRPQITWFSQTYTREESCSLWKKRNPLYSAQEPSLSSCSDQVWNIFFPNITQNRTLINAMLVAFKTGH
jgi:hypothetical protein